MRANVFALAAGFLFGLGLWLSGMANPAKVLGFLDVTGNWDPSLMLVMGGALAVTFPGFRQALKLERPIAAPRFFLPETRHIDVPLVAGAALFGVGWGIAGYCPGPAMTAISTLSTESLVFVAAMAAGGILHRLVTPQQA